MQKKWIRALTMALAASLCFGSALADPASSERVLEIERALYSLGYHEDNFDALMDDVTRKAVRSFQAANGLKATGELDRDTLQLIDSGMGISCHEYLVSLRAEYADLPILQSGSAGEAVYNLQKRLRELGYFAGECDGAFGEATLAAVMRFQMANGLTETGTADQATQLRLNEGTPLSWQAFLESSVAVFGDEGLHVRQLQRKLQRLGYFKGDCTGKYGELTQRAVNRFQEKHGLTVSGMADLNTCTAIYGGTALPLQNPDAIRVGDSTEAVADVQGKLAAYGYFDRNITGVFGATTEIAVRLFQLANGLPATGEVDDETQVLLDCGEGVNLETVRESFRSQVQNQGDSARTVIGSVAQRLRGQSFEPDDEDLYGGFAFVQYVCLSAGIPLVTPEELLALTQEPVQNYSDPQAGDILAIYRTDGSVMFAVSSGNGSAVYATQDVGYVLESDLRNLSGSQVFRWNMQVAQ